MKPIFEELTVNAKVIKCKKCKNEKYYVLLKDVNSNMLLDIFSDIPYDINNTYDLKLWKVTETKYYVKKDK